MKPAAILVLVLSFLAVLLFSAPARATSSLTFEAGGYLIDMEVGDARRPAIARVRFHAPGDALGAVLPADRVSNEAFDPGRQRLSLRYSGGNGVAPFSLSVDGPVATLVIGSKQVSAAFDWPM